MSFAMNLIWVVSSSWAHFFLNPNTCSEIKLELKPRICVALLLVSSVAQFGFGDNKECEEPWESQVCSVVLVSCHMVKFKAVIFKCGEVGKPDFGSEFIFSINYIFILISCIVPVLQKIALCLQFWVIDSDTPEVQENPETAYCV